MGNADHNPHRTAHPDAPVLHLVFPGEVTAVREALQTAMVSLSGLKLGAETDGVIEIVLAEVLNNIVEHAFRDLGRGIIELDIAHAPWALDIRIQDDGAPMPGGAAPAGAAQDIGVATADLPEGGFGWLLIRELTEGLAYRRQGSRNELTFRIPLKAKAPGT